MTGTATRDLTEEDIDMVVHRSRLRPHRHLHCHRTQLRAHTTINITTPRTTSQHRGGHRYGCSYNYQHHNTEDITTPRRTSIWLLIQLSTSQHRGGHRHGCSSVSLIQLSTSASPPCHQRLLCQCFMSSYTTSTQLNECYST